MLYLPTRYKSFKYPSLNLAYHWYGDSLFGFSLAILLGKGIRFYTPMYTLEDAIDLLSTSQVNLQLEFSTDKDQYLLYCLRVLPWRNNARQGYMILVADHTLTSCLIMAAEDYKADRWSILNWKIALQEPGRYFGYGGIGLIRSAGTLAETDAPKPGNVVKIHNTTEGENRA